MRLVSARVKNDKSIPDSGDVAIEPDVTTLVGKNVTVEKRALLGCTPMAADLKALFLNCFVAGETGTIERDGRVSAWCSPAIFWRGGSPAGGWAFKNLAGAMWLQMFFALTGDHTGRMCANPDCPNPDFPMHRTTRPDGKKDTGPQRKYCSVDCRMHAHYVNKTKPGRRKDRTPK